MKSKSLLSGIGNHLQTKKYYDDWSQNYDQSLSQWDYRAPKKVSLILKSHKKIYPKKILDLACGTGLFAEELIKIYPGALIDGVDISKKIINIARNKKIYNNLICANFDKKFSTIYKYDLISCIGAMTYTNNPKKLLKSMHNKLKDSGFLIFTHRVDLIIKQNFIKILEDVSNHWKVYYKSRPLLYLPNNKDFKDKIKIKIILLKKIKSED